MAKVVRCTWVSEASSGLARADRLSCEYDAYIPDALTGRSYTFSGPVAADVTDAESAIARLDVETAALVDTEALARLLLRAESVASSRIEGLEVGARRLLRAEAGRALEGRRTDATANEVLGNIEAMLYSVKSVGVGDEISVAHLLEVHRRLLEGSRLEEHGGRIRTVQNWIGGSSFNPCSAAFVPPPPESVDGLLVDLCDFCNDDSLPAIAQAAIAHAQFETIHPFIDGNGRTGRVLIHLVLRRRGLTSRVVPPISLVLATWADDYIRALDGTRYLGSPASLEACEGSDRLIGLVAAACGHAVADAMDFERRIAALETSWRGRLGGIRSESAVDLLLRLLPGAPVLNVATAADLIGRSGQAANGAIERLVKAGVLKQIGGGSRNRVFEATEVIDAFTDLERGLASPAGDTRVAPPVRRVPRRSH